MDLLFDPKQYHTHKYAVMEKQQNHPVLFHTEQSGRSQFYSLDKRTDHLVWNSSDGNDIPSILRYGASNFINLPLMYGAELISLETRDPALHTTINGSCLYTLQNTSTQEPLS